jgi:hypothetical protein
VPLFLSVSGQTADMINLGFPQLRELIRGRVMDGKITVLTSPYSPAAYTLMDRWQTVYLLRRGRASCAAIWETAENAAAGLSGGQYDLSIPEKLGDAGVELLLGGVAADDFQAESIKETPVVVGGPGDRSLAVAPSCGEADRAEILADPGAAARKIGAMVNEKTGSSAKAALAVRIPADASFKRKGDKGDPETAIKEFFAGLSGAPGLEIVSGLPSPPPPDAACCWVSPRGDYSRFVSDDSERELMGRIQNCLRRLGDLEQNRRLSEFQGGQDIAMQVLLVDEARRQLSLAANPGVSGPEAHKDKRALAGSSIASAERLIETAEALYSEGITFEAVEIPEWQYADGELPGGSSPIFSSPRSEFWSAVELPHVTVGGGDGDVPDAAVWAGGRRIENWPAGFEAETVEEEWGWYRTEKLFLPPQWDGRPLLLLFDGLAGDAYVVVNGEWQQAVSRPEEWRPVESEWGGKLYGRLLMDATEILKPGRDNRLLIKIRNRSGVRGIYGRSVVISPVK